MRRAGQGMTKREAELKTGGKDMAWAMQAMVGQRRVEYAKSDKGAGLKVRQGIVGQGRVGQRMTETEES